MNTFSIPSEWISKPLNILVIGAGGTGSAFLSECFQLDYLLRKVTNHQVHLNISVYDDDKVSESNVGGKGFILLMLVCIKLKRLFQGLTYMAT